eukprot:6181969-Karenia_brevis.AAC.1
MTPSGQYGQHLWPLRPFVSALTSYHMAHFMDKQDVAVQRLCLTLYPKAPIPLVMCPEKKVGRRIRCKRGNPPPGCNDYCANT